MLNETDPISSASPRTEGRRRLASIFWLLLSLVACGGPSADLAVKPTPPQPSAPTLTPVAAAADPAVAATSTPVPTSTPTRTPRPTRTPVPLPKVCLAAQFAHDLEDCGNISSYEIALTVDPSAARVVGTQEIRYTNLEDEPLEDIYLRLFPNTPSFGGYVTVTHMLMNRQAVTPTLELDGTALRLSMTPPLTIGQSVALSMEFAVDVPTTDRVGHGLFSYLRGVMALPTIYPLIPVYDDEGWNLDIPPVHSDDTYTDIAAYQVQVTAPSTMTPIASGSCVQRTQDSQATTWTCEAGPVRDFVLILGERFKLANRLAEGVVVNSYYYPEHARAGGQVAEIAAAALETFTELFGRYPYTELDVVETPNNLGGMEYPGLVVVEDELYPTMTRVEWLVAHEVAHQWWFGVVGNDQIDEPWLDEALTQYSTMLYFEKVYGPDRAASVLRSEFVETHERLVRSGHDLPAGLPASAYRPSLYWQVVYDKGALYFHELRQAVGDELFFEILKAHYAQHRYGIATPESFLEVVESVTGDRYLDIFEEWIGKPEL
jgi:hypothetical protein